MGRSYASTGVMILTVGLLLLVAAGPAEAAWSAEVWTSPNNAYQGVSFDYSVTVTNMGDRPMHVTEITLDIRWPHEWHFPDSSPPHEFYRIYSGNWTIEAGEAHTFRSSVKTGFYGTFPTTTTIVAYQEGDGLTTNRSYSGSISFTSAPPMSASPMFRVFCIGSLFFVLLGANIGGFYWRKSYWEPEIKHALKERVQDDIQWWKWHAYYWEADGEMWKNWLLWICSAALFTTIVAIPLLR